MMRSAKTGPMPYTESSCCRVAVYRVSAALGVASGFGVGCCPAALYLETPRGALGSPLRSASGEPCQYLPHDSSCCSSMEWYLERCPTCTPFCPDQQQLTFQFVQQTPAAPGLISLSLLEATV